MKYLTNQNLSFNSLAVIYIGPVIKNWILIQDTYSQLKACTLVKMLILQIGGN